MCKGVIRTRAWLMAALCLVASLSSASAQHGAVRDQQARVARLSKAYDVDHQVEQRAFRAALAKRVIDTTVAGPLHVLSVPDVASHVHRGAAMAWRRLAPYFGADSGVLDSPWYAIEVRDGPSFPVELSLTRYYGVVRVKVDSQDVAGLLASLISGALAERAGARFQDWVGNAMPMPYDSTTLRNVYLELVTAPVQIAHRCFSGDLVACRGALELDSLPDPATEWYSPAERELVAARMPPNRYQRQIEFTRCTGEHDDVSCIAFLRAAPPFVLRLPLSYVARRSIVRTALAMGGRGAHGRLMASHGPVRDRLAAAAGVSTDSLVKVWRAQVMAAKPPSERVGAATQWSTIFWVMVLASLALRSSRWRSV